MKKDMRLMSLFFVGMSSISTLLCAAPSKEKPELPPVVSSVDFSRFEGIWFELSRIPIPIAKDWVNTVDVYIHNPDGSWSVRYEGNKGSFTGKRKVLKQKLRIPNPQDPGNMQVSFIPFIWMDYRLIYLSEDYRFMLVGSKSMDLLWLLSTEQIPTEEEYTTLVNKAVELGYDVSLLERVPQKKM